MGIHSLLQQNFVHLLSVWVAGVRLKRWRKQAGWWLKNLTSTCQSTGWDIECRWRSLSTPPTHTNPRHIEKKKFWVFSCDKGMTVALNASLNMCQLMQGGAATLCRRRTDSEVPWDSDWFRGQTDAPVTPLKSKNKSHIVLLWPCALCVSWCGKTFKYFYYPVRRGKPTYHP